jgi:hypothetical protein
MTATFPGGVAAESLPGKAHGVDPRNLAVVARLRTVAVLEATAEDVNENRKFSLPDLAEVQTLR